jgi:hypothetical protein
MSQASLTKFFPKIGTPTKTQPTSTGNGEDMKNELSKAKRLNKNSNGISPSKSSTTSHAQSSPFLSQSPSTSTSNKKQIKQKLFSSDDKSQQEKKRVRQDEDGNDADDCTLQSLKKRHMDEDEEEPIQQLRKFMAPSKSAEQDCTQEIPLLTKRSERKSAIVNGGGEDTIDNNKSENIKAGFLFPDWLVHPKDANKHPVGHPEYLYLFIKKNTPLHPV